MIVAIDGPAGAGKSSVARAVADALGFEYLDTGALYRAVALAVVEAGAPPNDQDAVARIARSARVGLEKDRVTLDDRDISQRIRDEDVTAAVSTVSANPRVREVLIERQRALAVKRDVVMEGRDIATVVLPDAPVKVFLTASLDERARRRCLQLGLAPEGDSFARIRAAIAARDAADESRSAAPLTQAADAVLIDSTELPFGDVVDSIVGLVRSKERGDAPE